MSKYFFVIGVVAITIIFTIMMLVIMTYEIELRNRRIQEQLIEYGLMDGSTAGANAVTLEELQSMQN